TNPPVSRATVCVARVAWGANPPLNWPGYALLIMEYLASVQLAKDITDLFTHTHTHTHTHSHTPYTHTHTHLPPTHTHTRVTTLAGLGPAPGYLHICSVSVSLAGNGKQVYPRC